MSKFLLYIPILLLLSCETSKHNSVEDLYVPSLEGSYDLNSPIDKFFLPYILEEISGLGFIEGGSLACVQDEKATLFFYDLKAREIKSTIEFGKAGDFEGIEIVGDTAYAVKSNGDIYMFSIKNENPLVRKFDTPLEKNNNVEGLAYDTRTKNLILVCKDYSDIGNKEIIGKAVFQFDLRNETLDTEPVLSITKNDLKSFFEMNKEKAFDVKNLNFKPSGIALHPIQDKYYILAHIGKMLLVVNRSGEVEASYPIANSILVQPEGICFAPNGDMFIASEGDGGKGFVLKYEMVK